jgi:hypothetical protein
MVEPEQSPLLDNGSLKACFVATDETENNREQLTVRHGDFYLGCVIVIKVSAFVNSRDRLFRQQCEILQVAFVRQTSFGISSMFELL